MLTTLDASSATPTTFARQVIERLQAALPRPELLNVVLTLRENMG